MAKISARGATEVSRVHGHTAGGNGVTLVLTSDGRVLRKWDGEGYNLIGKITDKAKRTPEVLARIFSERGYAP
jgi:hypothetical protein